MKDDMVTEQNTTGNQLAHALEALLLVTDAPLSIMSLASATGAPVADVSIAVGELVEDYDGHAGGPERGFELREVAGGWRLYVREKYDDLIRAFVAEDSSSRLSQAALETLAVIAYKQPITRSSVAAIRAVNVDSVIRTLLNRGLVAELFADSETGAINYGTTDLLLEKLGINAVEELPPIAPLLPDGSEGFESNV